MQCPLCKTEAIITSSKMVFVESEQKLYRKIEISCRNKKCNNYQKVIATEMNEMNVDIENGNA